MKHNYNGHYYIPMVTYYLESEVTYYWYVLSNHKGDMLTRMYFDTPLETCEPEHHNYKVAQQVVDKEIIAKNHKLEKDYDMALEEAKKAFIEVKKYNNNSVKSYGVMVLDEECNILYPIIIPD